MTIPVNYEEYVQPLESATREKLDQLRTIILAAAPEIKERIAWKTPTYYYHDKYLVQIAAVKHGVAFYTSPETKASFAEELEPYKQTSKNAVHFQLDQELPTDLVRRMVRSRMAEKDAAS